MLFLTKDTVNPHSLGKYDVNIETSYSWYFVPTNVFDFFIRIRIGVIIFSIFRMLLVCFVSIREIYDSVALGFIWSLVEQECHLQLNIFFSTDGDSYVSTYWTYCNRDSINNWPCSSSKVFKCYRIKIIGTRKVITTSIPFRSVRNRFLTTIAVSPSVNIRIIWTI